MPGARDDALRTGTARAKALEEEKRSLELEKNRLKRIAAALPTLAQRRELLEKLADRANVPRLRETFGENLVEAQNGLLAAERLIKEAHARLAEIEEKRRTAPIVLTELLDDAQEIEELYQKLGEYRKAEEDRPQLEEFKQNREHSARTSSKSWDEAGLATLKTMRSGCGSAPMKYWRSKTLP